MVHSATVGCICNGGPRRRFNNLICKMSYTAHYCIHKMIDSGTSSSLPSLPLISYRPRIQTNSSSSSPITTAGCLEPIARTIPNYKPNLHGYQVCSAMKHPPKEAETSAEKWTQLLFCICQNPQQYNVVRT